MRHRIATLIFITFSATSVGGSSALALVQNHKQSAITLKGHLVDVSCAVKHTKEQNTDKNWVQDHDRQCLVKADSFKSGYAVYTIEKAIYRFDETGNKIAKKLIADTKKEIDWKVTVTGLVERDIISVSDLVLEK